jgi:hypothetical protein
MLGYLLMCVSVCVPEHIHLSCRWRPGMYSGLFVCLFFVVSITLDTGSHTEPITYQFGRLAG